MKRKVFLVGALLLSPVLGIFVAAREAASWPPVLVGVGSCRSGFSVSRGGWIQTYEPQGVSLQRGGHVLEQYGFEYAFLSPDESLIALSGVHWDLIRIVRTQDEKPVQAWHDLLLQRNEFFEAGHFENDNRILVVASLFRVLRLDVESGKVLSQVKMRFPIQWATNPYMVNSVFFLRNGDLCYFNGDKVFVVDARTGIPKRNAEGGNLSPDESLIWGWSPETSTGYVADSRMGKTLWEKEMDTAPVFSPDSRSLLIVHNKRVRLVNARDGKLIRELKVLPANYYAFSPDGNALYSLQHDGQILRWRLR